MKETKKREKVKEMTIYGERQEKKNKAFKKGGGIKLNKMSSLIIYST